MTTNYKGFKIKAKKTKAGWIAEFADELTDNRTRPQHTEKQAIEQAERIIDEVHNLENRK